MFCTHNLELLNLCTMSRREKLFSLSIKIHVILRCTQVYAWILLSFKENPRYHLCEKLWHTACSYIRSYKWENSLWLCLTPDVGNEEMFSQANSNTLLHDCEEATPTACNKETGEKRRLQKWSRGHFFIVRVVEWLTNGISFLGTCSSFFYYLYLAITCIRRMNYSWSSHKRLQKSGRNWGGSLMRMGSCMQPRPKTIEAGRLRGLLE